MRFLGQFFFVIFAGLLISLLFLFPLVVLWAFNTVVGGPLLDDSIPLNFWTWLGTLVLMATFLGTSVRHND